MPADDVIGRDAEDVPLVERITAGDTRALDVLMRRHTPRLMALALAITRSHETASEVVQDVFVRLWERRATLDPHGGVGGYLWHVTRTRALSALRRDRLERRVMQLVTQDPGEARRRSYNEGDRDLDAASTEAEVLSALAGLPARCQEIFLLKFKYEMSAEDIAAALGISLATTRNQLSRAVRHLAEHLGRR